jgi:hypothetical protein
VGFIDFIQNNWYAMAEGLGYLILAAGAIVGFFDGPKADKAKTIFDRILGILRQVGIGTFKDEPGTMSIPFKGDSGVRVETTKAA